MFSKNEIRNLLICLQWELANARVSSEQKKIMGIIIISWFVSFRTAWIISGTFWNDQKIYLNSLIFSIYTFLLLNYFENFNVYSKNLFWFSSYTVLCKAFHCNVRKAIFPSSKKILWEKNWRYFRFYIYIYISFLLIYFVNDLPPDLEVVDFCRDHLILTMANKGFSVDITNNISYYIHLFIKAKTFLILAMDQKLQKHRKNSGGISLMGVN